MRKLLSAFSLILLSLGLTSCSALLTGMLMGMSSYPASYNSWNSPSWNSPSWDNPTCFPYQPPVAPSWGNVSSSYSWSSNSSSSSSKSSSRSSSSKSSKVTSTTKEESSANAYSFENVVDDAAKDILEITKPFFDTNKTYSVKSFLIIGIRDYLYEKRETTVSVKDKVVTIKYKDGSGTTKRIVGGIKNCTVPKISGGDVTIPMYLLENGNGIRAIQSKSDKTIRLYTYAYNHNSEKYICTCMYELYREGSVYL